MGLKIHLDKGQRVMIGRAIVTNVDHRTTLHIDGPLPILKDKDILEEGEVVTNVHKLYMLIQTNYQTETLPRNNPKYSELMFQLMTEHPDHYKTLLQVDQLLSTGEIYKALKTVRLLIDPKQA